MPRKVDVVIPVKNESEKLRFCCESVLKHIPVNNLIIVVSPSKDRTLQVAEHFGDIVFTDENNGIGHARALGLEKVETEFYASIDADIIIPGNWYSVCSDSIKKERVAACQGYDRPIGKNYVKWDQILLGENRCTLGNTMLRTDVIREVGMPTRSWLEDYFLRDRLEFRGYKWVTRFEVVSTHWVTDIDMIRHYGARGGQQRTRLSNIWKWILSSVRAAPKNYFQYRDLNFSIFLLLARLARCFGATQALARHDRTYEDLFFW